MRTAIVIHCVLAVLVLAASFVVWGKLVLLLVLGVSLYFSWQKFNALKSIANISVRNEQWALDIKGERETAMVWQQPLLLHWLVLLYLRTGQKRWVIPVLKDSTDAENFRKLRVYLNLSRN